MRVTPVKLDSSFFAGIGIKKTHICLESESQSEKNTGKFWNLNRNHWRHAWNRASVGALGHTHTHTHNSTSALFVSRIACPFDSHLYDGLNVKLHFLLGSEWNWTQGLSNFHPHLNWNWNQEIVEIEGHWWELNIDEATNHLFETTKADNRFPKKSAYSLLCNHIKGTSPIDCWYALFGWVPPWLELLL